jgi:hypothetical protein
MRVDTTVHCYCSILPDRTAFLYDRVACIARIGRDAAQHAPPSQRDRMMARLIALDAGDQMRKSADMSSSVRASISPLRHAFMNVS